jgi:biopolymer transport protein ExbD
MAKRRRKKKRKSLGTLELNMTAMCDVIFLLLIYLILTAKPLIVLAQLDVNRPSPDPNQKTPEKIKDMIEIMVFQDAFTVNGKRVQTPGLVSVLKELSSLDKGQTILIKCAWDSPHAKLMEVLDLCGEMGLSNISVMSMYGPVGASTPNTIP